MPNIINERFDEYRLVVICSDPIVFDETKDTTAIDLKVNTAIAGLRGGLTIFGKNGSGKIYVPSTLGYGDSPPFGVRKNAILVYDVKILDVY